MSAIVRHHGSRQQFTQVANDAARDSRLSLQARGLLVMLLSFTDGWQTSERRLADQCGCGRRRIRTCLDELESHGYLLRCEQQRDDDGTLGRSEWKVTDVPDSAPWYRYPTTDEPTTDEPTTDSDTTKNTDSKKMDVKKKEQQPAAAIDVSHDVGGFPRLAFIPNDTTRVDVLLDWLADTADHHPEFTDLTGKYRAALRSAAHFAPFDPHEDRSRWLRAAGPVVAEYLATVTGEKLTRADITHLQRLVTKRGTERMLDLIDQAVAKGAGLDDEYADKPVRSVLRYAEAVGRGEDAEARRGPSR